MVDIDALTQLPSACLTRRQDVCGCVCVCPVVFNGLTGGREGLHNPGNLRLESVKKCHFLEYSCIEISFWILSWRGGHSGGCLTFLMYTYLMVPCWEFHWTCTIDLKQFRVAKLLTLGHVGG